MCLLAELPLNSLALAISPSKPAYTVSSNLWWGTGQRGKRNSTYAYHCHIIDVYLVFSGLTLDPEWSDHVWTCAHLGLDNGSQTIQRFVISLSVQWESAFGTLWSAPKAPLYWQVNFTLALPRIAQWLFQECHPALTLPHTFEWWPICKRPVGAWLIALCYWLSTWCMGQPLCNPLHSFWCIVNTYQVYKHVLTYTYTHMYTRTTHGMRGQL